MERNLIELVSEQACEASARHYPTQLLNFLFLLSLFFSPFFYHKYLSSRWQTLQSQCQREQLTALGSLSGKKSWMNISQNLLTIRFNDKVLYIIYNWYVILSLHDWLYESNMSVYMLFEVQWRKFHFQLSGVRKKTFYGSTINVFVLISYYGTTHL